MSYIEIALGLWWLMNRKGGGGGGKLPPETPSNAVDDGIKLQARANQAQAAAWHPILMSQDATDSQAGALTRWIGIESSGDATIVSSLGERGLLQIGKAMQSDGALTDAEFEALSSPATTKEEHARMAMKLLRWLVQRVSKHVGNFPTDGAPDQIWYAKLYHQRPVDVRDGKLHGPAQPMARELAQRWAKDPKKMHLLRAANVVAFGVAAP